MNQAPAHFTPFTAADLHACADNSANVLKLVEEALQDRRKAEAEKERFQFLNRVLANASTTLDVEAMLETLGNDLATQAPVAEIMAVFLHDGLSAESHEFIIAASHDSGETATRRTMLLRALDKYTGKGAGLLHTASSNLTPKTLDGWAAETIFAPMQACGRIYGVIGVLTTAPATPEQTELIRTACTHIQQPLANAREFNRMRSLASRDGLTGLHNRRAFDERLEEEISRHARANATFSLILFDIDHFKKINDTYGHEAGDEALRTISDTIGKTIRVTDFGARYGGEEFAIILPNTHQEQANILAERLRERVEKNITRHPAGTIKATISLGLSSYDPQYPESPASLVRRADSALYEAKNNGRNQVRAA